MHLLLTDILTCPRCGPEFGLILLAERIEERRVLEGSLGCSNCRAQYPITSGFADLRLDPALPAASPPAPEVAESLDPAATPRDPGTPEDHALRLAALLGLGEGRGRSLLVGELAEHARALSVLVEGAEVVASWEAARAWPEEAGVSRIAAVGLPFATRTLRGVALEARSGIALAEAARVVAPLGRLVLAGWGGDVATQLTAAGLDVLAAEGDTVVAGRMSAD